MKPVYGHQGVFSAGRALFFFGCENYDKKNNLRNCNNGIVTYEPIRNYVEWQVPEHANNRVAVGRKYFAGFTLYNSYYCHGGIDAQGQVLNQMLEINLNTKMWREVNLLELST